MHTQTQERTYTLEELLPKEPIAHVFNYALATTRTGEPSPALCGAIGIPQGLSSSPDFPHTLSPNICKPCMHIYHQKTGGAR